MTVNLNRLKAERVAQGYTQQQFAEQLGKKRAWYAKRESGIVEIGADELAEIARALRVEDIRIFFTNNVPEKQQ